MVLNYSLYMLTFICRCQRGYLRLRESGRHMRSHRRSGCSGSDWQHLAWGGNGRRYQEWWAGRCNSWGIGSIMGSDSENRRVLNRYGRWNHHRYTYSRATWVNGRVRAYSVGRVLWWASSDSPRGWSCTSDVTYHCSNITLSLCGANISGDWWCVWKKKETSNAFSTFFSYTHRAWYVCVKWSEVKCIIGLIA